MFFFSLTLSLHREWALSPETGTAWAALTIVLSHMESQVPSVCNLPTDWLPKPEGDLPSC